MKSCNTKMVYMPSDVPENLDITGLEKHLGRVITCIKTNLMGQKRCYRGDGSQISFRMRRTLSNQGLFDIYNHNLHRPATHPALKLFKRKSYDCLFYISNILVRFAFARLKF